MLAFESPLADAVVLGSGWLLRVDLSQGVALTWGMAERIGADTRQSGSGGNDNGRRWRPWC